MWCNAHKRRALDCLSDAEERELLELRSKLEYERRAREASDAAFTESVESEKVVRINLNRIMKERDVALLQVDDMKTAIRALMLDRWKRANNPDPLERLGLDADTLTRLESFVVEKRVGDCFQCKIAATADREFCPVHETKKLGGHES